MATQILNLLLVPLLGGYVFYSKFHATAFAARQAEGQRLIYSSAVAGFASLVVARAIALFVDEISSNPVFATDAYAFGSLALIASAAAAANLLWEFGYRKPVKSRVLAITARVVALSFAIFALWFQFLIFGASLSLGLRSLVAYIFVSLILVTCAAFILSATNKTSQSAPVLVIRIGLAWMLIVAIVLNVVIYGPAVAAWWPTFSTLEFSGIALTAAFVGFTAWLPLNILITEEWAWRRAHESGRTSSFERLLYRAFSAGEPVQITMKDGKVYVGFVLEIPAPQHSEAACIEFVPIKSGYRRANTKRIVTTTNYANVLRKMAEKAQQDAGEPHSKKEQSEDIRSLLAPAVASMTKVVPISEISVAGLFNEKYTDRDFAVKRPRRTRTKAAQNSTKPNSMQPPPSESGPS